MDRLQALMQELRSFVTEREWEQFHDPKNLAMALASEVGELLAEYRWVRNVEADSFSTGETQRGRIAAEAADVGISLLLFCDRIGIDLIEVMKEKIAINARNYPVEQARGRSGRRDEGNPEPGRDSSKGL